MKDIPNNLRILVVDDDNISLSLLADHLNSSGNQILVAPSAAAAMEILSRNPVHIVIADWVMPGMTGVELCRWTRGRDNCRTIHFVILTVYSEKEKLIEAFDAGVDDFLSKPVHEGELLARLRAWKRMIQLRSELEGQYSTVAKLNRDLVTANGRLNELATIDELTGLPNRRQAVTRLQEHLAARQRYGDCFCCAVVDIDNFKTLNDTHGHAFGDMVLRQTGQELRKSIREVDEVFRIGGDEFLIVFPRQTIKDAAVVAERCRAAIESTPILRHGSQINWTISIGIAEPTKDAKVPLEFLEEADQALYAAKAKGRNCLAVEEPDASLFA